MSGTSSAEPQALARYSTRALALDADLLAGSARLAGVLAVFESLCAESSFRVNVSRLPGKATGHGGCPAGGCVGGYSGSGFRLADSGALQHIFDGYLGIHICPAFPDMDLVVLPCLGRFPYFWRPWPGNYQSLRFYRGHFKGPLLASLPWLSPKEESPTFCCCPSHQTQFGDLIEPKPAMPNPGQTANGINPSVNEQTKLGKLIPTNAGGEKQEILDSIKKRMDRLPNDKKSSV